MLLGRVLGSVVATQKNEKLEGAKLLLVQPLDLQDQPRGAAILAIDGVDAAIVGIIDEIEVRGGD